MGRDLHAHLEYYDKEVGIWEGIAEFHFQRHRKLFDVLIQNAHGMPKGSAVTLTFAAPNLLSNEIWAAWIGDKRRLGIHHEGYLSYAELVKLSNALLLDNVPVPHELQSLIAAAGIYAQETEIRFVYWFDN